MAEIRTNTAAPAGRSRGRAGFTLIEMLAALAIAGAIFGVIAEFSGRLLLNWNRSEATISIMEMLTRGLGRLGSDLALALPMSPPGSDGTITYFSGDPTHLTFVAATGFGVGDRGLELLNFSMTDRNDDFYLVRTRAPVSNPPSEFKDPVLLLHGRMQVRFAYRDANGQLVDNWNKRPDLPTAIAVQVIGAGGPVFPRALMFPVPVNLSVDCLLPEDETIRPTRCSGPEAPQQPASAATGNPRNNGQ